MKVFLCVGLAESRSGFRDLNMSMPISPNRSAPKHSIGNAMSEDMVTSQSGIHLGMHPFTRLLYVQMVSMIV